MYYAALRPAEAVNRRESDCELPACGWGRIHLSKTAPEVGKRYTDNGALHDSKGLKHRPDDEVRPVPIPPELVTLLRWHLDAFGAASDGRLFRQPHDRIVGSSTYSQVWQAAREIAFTPAQVASPLPGRPYDLRHAAVSLWLNAGVPAPTVARRAGHSVEVLLRVYANCIDGDEAMANQRISGALGQAVMSSAMNASRPTLCAAIGGATWGNEPHLIPHISCEHWLRTADGGLRLHISDQRPRSDLRRLRWSECLLAGQRRVWDSNPRGRVNALAVFKTAAIGH